MPVNTPHSSYEKAAPIWKKIRTVLEGAEAIKEAGKEYLPKPEGQNDAEYLVYKKRALFYNATRKTLAGWLGSLFRRSPTFAAPSALELHLEALDAEGRSAPVFARAVAEETLSIGRAGLLVDYASEEDKAGRAYLCLYTAESIISWRCKMIGGVEVLTQVVLSEMEPVETDDPFVYETAIIYRVLLLRENTYIQQVWRKGEKDEYSLSEEYTPTQGSNPLDFIPFCFVGVQDLGADIDNAPLADLVEVNLSHYQTSADLEHARHLAGNPTYWASGVPQRDSKGQPVVLPVGASSAWLLPMQGNAGVLTLGADGVGALKEAITQKEDEMAHLGASLLRSQKREAETAESMKLQSAGETSLLSLVAASVESALLKTLRWMAWWEGENPEEVEVKLSREFFESRLSTAEVVSLLEQLDRLDAESPLSELIGAALEEGEALPEGMTSKELVERLKTAAAKRKAIAQTQPNPNTIANNEQPPQVAA